MTITTRIWYEKPVPGNEFSPQSSFLYGQEFFSDLAEKQSFVALTFLHLTGKTPTPKQEKQLGFLLNLAANPGIRDESSLTAMNTAIGSPPTVNSVMAGLMARSGLNRGAQWVERVMENLLTSRKFNSPLASFSPFSGLGKHYGHSDQRAQDAMLFLKKNDCWGSNCQWLESQATPGSDLLLEGIIAAGFLDILLSPSSGAVLFLIAAAPAFAAYAQEQQSMGYKKFPHYFEPGHYLHSVACPENSEDKEREDK